MLSESNSGEELEKLSNLILGLAAREPIERETVKSVKCQRAMSIREAVFSPSETVSVSESEGRICASPTVSCPPAVPIAISGEVISSECVRAFLRYGITRVSVVKK